MAGTVTFAGQTPQPGQAVEPEVTQQGSASTNTPVVETTGNTETGLTEARMREILAEEVSKAMEATSRKAQSLTAKAETRIKNEVTRQIALLKQANVPVGAEQAQALENAIRQQEAGNTETSQPDEAAQPETEETPEPLTAIDVQANAMMDALGTDLEPTDPEAATLDRSSEKAYLKSLLPALLAKQTRLASARMPVGGGNPAGGSPTAHLSGKDTLNYAYKQSK